MKRHPSDPGDASHQTKYTLNQLLQQSISNSYRSSASGPVRIAPKDSKWQTSAARISGSQMQQGMQPYIQPLQSRTDSQMQRMQGTTSQQYVFVPAVQSSAGSVAQRLSSLPEQNQHLRRVIHTTVQNSGTLIQGRKPYQLNATGSVLTVPSEGMVLNSNVQCDLTSKVPNTKGKFISLTDLSSQSNFRPLSPPVMQSGQNNAKLYISHPATAHQKHEQKMPVRVEENSTVSSHPAFFEDSTHLNQFDWDEYLRVSHATAAPHSSFKHVEVSLHNGFNPGMKLEVANKSDPSTYWVATLISTCGSLLLLRYDGYGNDRKTDFWADVCTADLHPIGWCAQNGKVLQPPASIRNIHENWAEFLVESLIGARTAPERLLSGPFKGKTVVEMINPGMLLEVQDSQHPQHVWMVDVLKNFGGRLLLRYKGLMDADAAHDFWLFYLDIRLHEVGWGKTHHLTMKPPDSIKNKYWSKEQWARVLSVSLKGVTEEHLVPACIFQDQVKLKQHNMKLSFKFAVLDPVDHTIIRPATVIKSVSEYFFLAEIDNLLERTNRAFLCHSGSSGIFSVEWCEKHDIQVSSPRGYKRESFSWDEYLNFTNSQAVPDSSFSHPSEAHEFEPGMKLEACNPYNLYEICVATVLKVYGSVLYLRLAVSFSGIGGSKEKYADCYVSCSSQDIFPVGWCHSNNYPLSAPQAWLIQKLSSCNVYCLNGEDAPESEKLPQEMHQAFTMQNHAPSSVMKPNVNSKLWCPVVCFNCVCKSGMFLNDEDLSRVPRYVGPGNTVLVLKEVLTLLVKAAERPHKLLKDLEDFTVGRWDQPCIIKTKFGGKKYQGTIHVVDSASEVPGFFKSLTHFLKCCPYLLTLEEPVETCPRNCTKERPMGYHLSSGRGRLIETLKTKNAGTDLKPRCDRIGYRMHEYPLHMTGRGRRPKLKKLLHSTYGKKFVISPTKIDFSLKLRNHQSQVKLDKLMLHSNPMNWSVEEVVEFMQSTDCVKWANFFSHHHVDGQAFLLLTLPVIQECLNFKLGVALKIARQVERVKIAFFEEFAGL